MNVMNCRGCGRLFNALSTEKICPACRQELDDKFQEVKTYLDEHRGANIEELSRETKVSVKQIKQWVREERLTFSEGSLDGIECENCGALIRTGRFCDSCKTRMATTLMSAYERPELQVPERRKPTNSSNRMRFIRDDQ